MYERAFRRADILVVVSGPLHGSYALSKYYVLFYQLILPLSAKVPELIKMLN